MALTQLTDLQPSNIKVTGIATFDQTVGVDGNVIGDNATNISGINSVTATTFYGSGANLTGLPAEITINNNGTSKVITGSGTANTINANVHLTFDGTRLDVKSGTGIVNAGSVIVGSAVTVNSTGVTFADTFTVENAGGFVAIDSTGQVGIGTTVPATDLHILSDKNALIKLVSTDANSGVQFIDPNTGNKPPVIYGVGDDFTIFTDYLERLRVKSNGNIGIGTTNPEYLDANFRELTISGGSEGAGLHLQDDNANVVGGFFTSDNTNAMIIRTRTNHPMMFRTNNVERLRITADGTVTKPQQPYVHINGITNTGGSGNANNGTATTYGDISYSNGRVTAQVEGNYLITFASISDNGTGRVDGNIRVNGSNIVNLLTSNNGTGYRQKSASIVYHLNANDYVDWYNEDWYAASSTSTNWRTASVYLLG